MMSASVIIVNNNKGGVGKSLVTQGLYLASVERGMSASIIEVEISARLQKLLGKKAVTHIQPPTQDPEQLYKNPDAIFQIWDKVFEKVAAKPDELFIIDIGANLFNLFTGWIESDGRDALLQAVGSRPLTFSAVVTMDKEALEAGLSGLSLIGELLPSARRAVIKNPLIADFIENDKRIDAAIASASGGGEIKIVGLERMAAPAWGHMMNMGRLDQLSSPAVKEELLSFLPAGMVRRSASVYDGWYINLINALLEII